MPRLFIAALIVVALIALLAFTARLNPQVSASPQELTVISQTGGNEVLTAVVLENEVKIRLKNNHKDTITAYAIKFSDTTIKEDFVYSEVPLGIEPGDTFERSYPISSSSPGKLPTVYLLTVLLQNGQKDGNAKVAQEIADVRLGNKIQVLRTLRILDKEEPTRKGAKALKVEITAALDAGEFDALALKKELLPASETDDSLSTNLKKGLHWGREKMLRSFQTLEQMPIERQEQGIIELKDRVRKLFAKL